MPRGTVQRQFPDDARQHIGHGLQHIGQELLEPGYAYRWARSEIGLIDGHDHDEIGIMSKQRPVLEGVEAVIVIMITEFVDESDTIPLMQGLQSSPHPLVVLREELLDVRIVTIASLHIHDDAIIVDAFNLAYNRINIALVSAGPINIDRLLLRSPRFS